MIDDASPVPPELGSNRYDWIAAAIRSVVGAAPFVGSLLSEICTSVIPHQRSARLEQYVRFLAEEIAKLRDQAPQEAQTEEELCNSLKDPESVHLFEIGASQAVQAPSLERLQYIARLVAGGMASEQRAKIHKQRLLSIFGDLDNEEVLILDAFGSRDSRKFDRVRPQGLHLGSGDEALNASAMYSAAIDKLVRYSLLMFLPSTTTLSQPTNTGGPPRPVVVPKLNSNGRPEGTHTLTRTGRMLLDAIGLTRKIPDSGGLSMRPAPNQE